MLWLIEKYMRRLARWSDRAAARNEARDPDRAKDMHEIVDEIRGLKRPKRGR